MTRVLSAVALIALSCALGVTQDKPKPADPNGPAPPLPQAYTDTPPPGWLPVTRLDDNR